MGFAFNLKAAPQEKKSGLPGWATAFLVIIGLLLLGIGAFFLRKCLIARREKNMLFKPTDPNALLGGKGVTLTKTDSLDGSSV